MPSVRYLTHVHHSVCLKGPKTASCVIIFKQIIKLIFLPYLFLYHIPGAIHLDSAEEAAALISFPCFAQVVLSSHTPIYSLSTRPSHSTRFTQAFLAMISGPDQFLRRVKGQRKNRRSKAFVSRQVRLQLFRILEEKAESALLLGALTPQTHFGGL